MQEIKSDALIFAEKTADGFKKKADRNKHEAMGSFLVIIVSSLAAPLFITLCNGQFLEKVLPSILSVLAAAFTSWLQLRKPQKLWSMYRSSQRLIEDQITKYNFKIGDYKTNTDADALLAERVASIALNAHNEWVNVVPDPKLSELNEIKGA